MIPVRFNSKTTPWRVIIPGRFSPDHKRQVKYFKTKETAENFICTASNFGTPAALNIKAQSLEQMHVQIAMRYLMKKLSCDPIHAINLLLQAFSTNNGNNE